MYHRAGYTGRVHRSAPSRRTPRAVRKALCECARGRGWLRAAPKKAPIVQYLGFNPSRAAPPGADVPPKYHTRPGHGAVRRAGLECRCATRGRLGENIWQTYGPARLPPPPLPKGRIFDILTPRAPRCRAQVLSVAHQWALRASLLGRTVAQGAPAPPCADAALCNSAPRRRLGAHAH
jgi:hypothetical protein